MHVIFGATGFLGRRVVAALASRGLPVRAVARRATETRLPELLGTGVERLDADVTVSASLEHALADASGVVNAVGHYTESARLTFEAVHVEAAGCIAAAATRIGVRRLVHVSGIGADAQSPSAYVRARAQGEVAVRCAFPGAVIVRPSVMFGPDDALLSGLEGATRWAPVFPLFGAGTTRVQPVHVVDVAEAIVRILTSDETPFDTYELGGPEVLEYRELVQRALAAHRRRRVLLPVPFIGWAVVARALTLLPAAPISVDQVELMRRDNVVGDGVGTLASFGISATGIDAALPGTGPQPG